VTITKGYAKTGSDSPNTGRDITFPDYDDIVRYNGKSCYQDSNSRKIRRVDSTNHKIPICNGRVNSGRVNSIDLKIIGPSGQLSSHTANFYVPYTYMGGDYDLKGSNYGTIDYEGTSDVNQIGSIANNDYRGQPLQMGTNIKYFGEHTNA
jgi:hypothetical protein